MNAETEATIAPIVDGEGQLSVAIQPEVHGAQPASNSWKADAQPPKHNQEPSTEASIDNEKDVSQRTKDRMKYKRGRFRLKTDDLRYASGKAAKNSFVVQEWRKYDHERELDIHMILPESVHDKMYCKSLCGLTLGDSILNEARYAVDVIAMFVFFIGNPLICWAAAISAMFSEENVPNWFPFVGVYFFVVSLPTIFYMFISGKVGEKASFLERDTNEVLRCLIPPALCCWIVFPVYGVYASTQLGAVADSNPILYYSAYVCCFIYLPSWPNGPSYVRYEYETIDQFDPFGQRVFFGTLMFLECSLLLGSVIHQAIVGELIWFPFLGAISLCVTTPLFVSYILFPIMVEAIDSICTSQRFYELSDPAGAASFGILTLVFTTLVASKDLSEPIPKLLEDDLLYGGAVMFYVEVIVLVIFQLVYVVSET